MRDVRPAEPLPGDYVTLISQNLDPTAAAGAIPKSILVIEDEPDILDLVAFHLGRAGSGFFACFRFFGCFRFFPGRSRRYGERGREGQALGRGQVKIR